MPVYSEKRVLPYQPTQLFDLVIDVARYPEFLPWCLAARIRKREEGLLIADLVIGFKMVRERFTSRVEFDADELCIDTVYAEGPFKHMHSRWHFLPHPEGCQIDFHVEFEFKSRLLQAIIKTLFAEAVQKMVGAFEGRARQLYGPGRGAPAAVAVG